MEIFATGLSSPECPIILDNGDLLVVEMRQDRSAITRIDGTTRYIHPIKLTGSFPNEKFAEDGGCFAPYWAPVRLRCSTPVDRLSIGSLRLVLPRPTSRSPRTVVIACTSPRSPRELWRSTTWTSTACPSSGN
jgi:hypothetical protein